jgi:hypothetical protein
MDDIIFNTSNEQKEFKKPHIKAGEYEFTVYEIKQDLNKSRVNFILELLDAQYEDEIVRLVWSAPTNEEYNPSTKVGKILLALGIKLGDPVNSSALTGGKGKCIVQDYSKQVGGKVVTYSIIGDLISFK